MVQLAFVGEGITIDTSSSSFAELYFWQKIDVFAFVGFYFSYILIAMILLLNLLIAMCAPTLAYVRAGFAYSSYVPTSMSIIVPCVVLLVVTDAARGNTSPPPPVLCPLSMTGHISQAVPCGTFSLSHVEATPSSPGSIPLTLPMHALLSLVGWDTLFRRSSVRQRYSGGCSLLGGCAVLSIRKTSSDPVRSRPLVP